MLGSACKRDDSPEEPKELEANSTRTSLDFICKLATRGHYVLMLYSPGDSEIGEGVGAVVGGLEASCGSGDAGNGGVRRAAA